MNSCTILLVLITLHTTTSDVCKKPLYALLTYDSINIGDDIQSLAARQYLPRVDTYVKRDDLNSFSSPEEYNIILNGFYMDKTQNWPPASMLKPKIISFHTAPKFVNTFKTNPSKINYFLKHQPIGARDEHTLTELGKLGIKTYFSGCLTLALPERNVKKENYILIIGSSKGFPDIISQYVKSKTKTPVKIMNQLLYTANKTAEQRLKIAEDYLDKYAKAKYVITSRLHVVLPCTSFRTPVLLLDEAADQNRFGSLNKLVRHGSISDFLAGKIDFDLNNPTPNPEDYMEIRTELQREMRQWVNDIEDNYTNCLKNNEKKDEI